jgi:hypothetical protein
MKAELTFVFERETKNTYRFEEMPDDNDKIIVGTLYVQKSAFEHMPSMLTVVIEAE